MSVASIGTVEKRVDPPSVSAEPAADVESHIHPNAALDQLAHGAAQNQRVCERAAREQRSDPVADAFCNGEPPQISSLHDLLKLLKLDPQTDNPGFALNAHSASLSVRDTSALNPRAVLMNGLNTDSPIALAYTRGEQAAEIVVRDRKSMTLAFYFVAYEQACNAAKSCELADVFSPRTESGWTQVSLYANEDIEGTILDCNTCHLVQRQGDQAPTKILRMQELITPWTHWLQPVTPGGSALIADYQAAHGTEEEYAGIPGNRIGASQPPVLQAFVSFLGSADQPNQFATANIEVQVANSAQGQPTNNDTPGTSSTWQTQYETSLRGEAIPTPYHDVKVTDSAKLTAMTKAYKAFQAGEPVAFPDFREVFREDRLHEMAGMRIEPKLRGGELVTAACSQCHNALLDQSLSRARFNVDFSKLSNNAGGVLAGAERDRELAYAIERIRLPAYDTRRMPPARIRDLTSEQIVEVTRHLCSQMSVPASVCSDVDGLTTR